jgi:hypothetical protein
MSAEAPGLTTPTGGHRRADTTAAFALREVPDPGAEPGPKDAAMQSGQDR